MGIRRGASASEVKSAYRKLVLRHHPDKSTDPRSHDIFIAVKEAYEVLSDPEQKRGYDADLDLQARKAAERERQLHEKARIAAENAAKAAAAATTATVAPPPPPPMNVRQEVERLNKIFTRGQHAEALKLAEEIVRVDPRQPLPYAVMGDLARRRGDMNVAATYYAYAAQFEPSNLVYQRRYEELLGATQVVVGKDHKTSLAPEDRKVLVPMAGAFVVLVGSAYLTLSKEHPVLTQVAPVSTWTLGLLVMLFLGGVSVGASLASGNLLDRFQSVSITATGRLGPMVVLGLVAVVNYWAAAALYLILGAVQRAFDYSSTRAFVGMTLALLSITLGCALSSGIDALQVLLWGGNLLYVGTVVGWMVADAFRS